MADRVVLSDGLPSCHANTEKSTALGSFELVFTGNRDVFYQIPKVTIELFDFF
tara:strand:+ start:2170 stop:2328 length:159 start_codon:yes stop_codon:yes gene_type:complete